MPEFVLKRITATNGAKGFIEFCTCNRQARGRAVSPGGRPWRSKGAFPQLQNIASQHVCRGIEQQSIQQVNRLQEQERLSAVRVAVVRERVIPRSRSVAVRTDRFDLEISRAPTPLSSLASDIRIESQTFIPSLPFPSQDTPTFIPSLLITMVRHLFGKSVANSLDAPQSDTMLHHCKQYLTNTTDSLPSSPSAPSPLSSTACSSSASSPRPRPQAASSCPRPPSRS